LKNNTRQELSGGFAREYQKIPTLSPLQSSSLAVSQKKTTPKIGSRHSSSHKGTIPAKTSKSLTLSANLKPFDEQKHLR
jgi:hypothetical protein